MKTTVSIFFITLLMLLHSSANAAGSWVQFQKFPYFNDGKGACRSELVESLSSELKSQGLPDEKIAEFKKDIFKKLHSSDVVLPLVNGSDVFVGINNRWVSTSPSCNNYLLRCKVDKNNSCKEVASFPNNQVVTVLFSDKDGIVARRETYVADSLNLSEKVDHILSNDDGKSWSKIQTPIPSCGDKGNACELMPISLSKYVFITTRYSEEKSDFDDASVYSSEDGGKTWVLSIDKWQGVNFPSWFSLSNETLVAIPAPKEHRISISEYDFKSKTKKEFQTSFQEKDWSHPNPGYVIKRGADYFLQLNDPHVGVRSSVFRLNQATATEVQTPVWTSGVTNVSDFKISNTAVVVKTWDSSAMSVVTGKFREKNHYSLGSNGKWDVLDVPEDLSDGTLLLSNKRIWLFLPDGIHYLDLPEKN